VPTSSYNKTVTLEEALVDEVEGTRGEASTSERVNELLKRALDVERQEKLDREAELFYGGAEKRPEERSFEKASLRANPPLGRLSGATLSRIDAAIRTALGLT
jgi:hypothetical protein